MNILIDQMFLYILGIILLTTQFPDLSSVIAALLGFSYSGAFFLIQNQRLRIVLLCSYVILCFYLPYLVYFLPAVTYGLMIKGRPLILPSVLMTGLVYKSSAPWQITLLLAAFGLSYYLYRKTTQLDEVSRTLIRQRDTSTELENALRERNQSIMEKQDYEIHLATLRERNRIAREIHDSVGHMLSRSILQIGALSTIYKEDPLKSQLTSVNESLNTAMNSIRESVHDLHDDAIDLRAGILETTKSMRDTYDIRLDYDMSREIPNNIKYAFLMIIKEALANTIKHSNADKISIIVREHPAFFQLAIEDNGTNPPPAEWTSTGPGHGIGLTNMRDRIEAMGGVFHAKYDKGFKIIATIKKEKHE